MSLGRMFALSSVTTVGVLLCVAGGTKTLRPCGCVRAVSNALSVEVASAHLVCTATVFIEVLVGAGLVIKPLELKQLLKGAGLLVVFLAWQLSVRSPCGCFGGGGLDAFPIARNSIMLACLVFGTCRVLADRRRPETERSYE